MTAFTSFASMLLLFFCLDLPHVYPLRPKPVSPLPFALSMPASPPDLFLAIAEASMPKSKNSGEAWQLDIVRFVDGEYARVVQPLPSLKNGFRYKVGQPVDSKALRVALMRGSAANPGDKVQITNIQFRDKQIIVSINGGTKRHFNWREHIQVSMGGAAPAAPASGPGPNGAELILDFGKHVPALTADDLKQDLSPFLNFSNERSSAVNWIETLPPEFQKAIKEHRALVGMNRDMVVAAKGRPDQKIREFSQSGAETEDWVYGHPPAPTELVTFSGDKVVRVKSYSP